MIVAQPRQTTEPQMYTFVMDNLVKLEQGLLTGVEARATARTGLHARPQLRVGEDLDNNRPGVVARSRKDNGVGEAEGRTCRGGALHTDEHDSLVRRRIPAAPAAFDLTDVLERTGRSQRPVVMRIRGVEQRENWRRARSEENLKRMEEMIYEKQQVEIRGL